jgi:hypothetical protein
MFKNEPMAPMAFAGDNFQNTDTIGGYGSLTSGIYSVGEKHSGFKAHGSLGQGAEG